MNWRRIIGLMLLAAGLAVGILKLTGKYDPAPAAQRLSKTLTAKASPRIAQVIGRVPADRAAYALLIVLPLGLGTVLLLVSLESKGRHPKLPAGAPIASAAPVRAAAASVRAAAVPARAAAAPAPAAAAASAGSAVGSAGTAPARAKPAKKAASKAVVHSCNVLEVRPDARQLWQFDARNGGFVLSREQTSFAGERFPAKLVGRSWRSLIRRKLNVAWLPPEHVFFRVAHLPQSDLQETVSMVELQLEKLSPMPVTQVVWSVQRVPHASGNMQTVIVIIAARDAVEEFLGKLEGEGYMADRLELPLLDQLHATAITDDGAWIYPEVLGGKNAGLAAWWYDGVLQNLALVTLPPDNRPASLKEQLMQMAWAGELEGWLTSPPRWHLVAASSVAAEWEPALREGLQEPVEVIEPLTPPELAALTARRAAQAEPIANLLPEEFRERYHQQFVDRLWMRGLLGVGALYVVGVAIYLVALQFLLLRTHSLGTEMASVGPKYTNAIQLKARLQVLRDRQDLKYAGLDCWETVAEKMPDTLTLDSMNFSDGHRLTLNGSVPLDQVQQLLDFHAAMRKAMLKGQQMFDPNRGENLNYHTINPGTYAWSFSLELKRAELP